MTERQSVAGAYQKIESHERECALRYKALEEGLSDLKLGVRVVIAGVCSLVLAVLGWLAVQVYDLNRAQMAPRQAAATVGLPEKDLAFQGADWPVQTVNSRTAAS